MFIFSAGLMIGAGKGVIRSIYCDQKSYGKIN